MVVLSGIVCQGSVTLAVVGVLDAITLVCPTPVPSMIFRGKPAYWLAGIRYPVWPIVSAEKMSVVPFTPLETPAVVTRNRR